MNGRSDRVHQRMVLYRFQPLRLLTFYASGRVVWPTLVVRYMYTSRIVINVARPITSIASIRWYRQREKSSTIKCQPERDASCTGGRLCKVNEYVGGGKH